ncbi:hypothetical protein QWJ39_09105 [Arthrobacter sp. YD4]|uniref:hypothetical protein n=1 Tax=Arthrobacter sp. YD4 TaxID=3058043 RepID=UPI0025B4B066|nr:hypothetical protein [Arthrobacter sp. YD4]MDN3936471.1 hypothetical protein [Arthrobacter sp. YD4]
MTDHRCARRPSPGAVAATLAATVLALTISAAPAKAETCAPVIVLPLGPCQPTAPSSPRPTATASPAPAPTTAPVAPAPAPAVPAPVAPAPVSPADRAAPAASGVPPATTAPATPTSPASPSRAPSASVPPQPAAPTLTAAAPTAGGATDAPEPGERGTMGLGAALLAGGGVLVSASAALGLRARRLRLR